MAKGVSILRGRVQAAWAAGFLQPFPWSEAKCYKSTWAVVAVLERAAVLTAAAMLALQTAVRQLVVAEAV